MDHDQFFKQLIREFFAEFMLLFFAEWAELLDFTKVEWLENEVFPAPPDGEKTLVDLLAKVKTTHRVGSKRSRKVEEMLALIHVEIEGRDRASEIRERMPHYYQPLRRKYGIPVLPIAIFLKVGMKGIGIDVYEEKFGTLTPLRFEYLYVGLPGLDGVQYVAGGNPLGVALSVLMKIPSERIAEIGAEALNKIFGLPLDRNRKTMLAECIEVYLPDDEEVQTELASLLKKPEYAGAKKMTLTSYGRGETAGLTKGRTEEALDILRDLLRVDFGSEGSEFAEALPSGITRETIRKMTVALHRSKSLDELRKIVPGAKEIR